MSHSSNAVLKENTAIYLSSVLRKIIISDKTAKKVTLSSACYIQRNRKTASKIKMIIYRE